MINKGFVIFAYGEKYVRQARLLALSLRKNSIYPVSLVTDDANINENIFDSVIEFPILNGNRYQTNARCQVFELSPYNETIVLDSDCLVLDDIDYFWNTIDNDIFYTTSAYTYRGNKINSDFYRKALTNNHLPNCYNAFFYFKKTNKTERFYNLLKDINKDWNTFYSLFCKDNTPSAPSMDISTAIALKISNYNNNSNLPFLTHMKPAVQGWNDVPDLWTNKINTYIDENCNIKIGNYLQKGILHYCEDEFVTDKLVERFENA